MSQPHPAIPVKVKVNDKDRSVTILIPWHQLSKAGLADREQWHASAEMIRAEWEAKGFQWGFSSQLEE
jgi:hypothetical protein